MTKFAIYVCPTGSLAEQIKRFLAEHRETAAPIQQGPDACCLLIEGFEEQSGAAPVYTRSLDRAYNRGLKARPTPVVTLEGLVVKPDWSGLAITSPWLKQVMVNFACTVKSPTRKTPLRIQDELGLPLAYGPNRKDNKAIVTQAKAAIDWKTPTQWEMRFYQQLTNQSWKCHSSWDLGEGQPAVMEASVS
jgi:hypothetical protein